jgi:hypothetical protein
VPRRKASRPCRATPRVRPRATAFSSEGRREFDKKVHARCRADDRRVWQTPLQCGDDPAAPAPVDEAGAADMAVIVAISEELRHRQLLGATRAVRQPLRRERGLDQGRRQHHPAKPQPRRKALARGSSVDDKFRRQGLDSADRLAVVAELAAVVVFDDETLLSGRALSKRRSPSTGREVGPRRSALTCAGTGPAMNVLYDERTLHDGLVATVHDFTVRSAAVEHGIEAYGLRIEAEGSSLAYSGDSAPCEALLRIAENVDLFLCAAGTMTSSTIHPNPRQAGELATAAGARHLVLTHLAPGSDEAEALALAASAYAGPLSLAVEGAQFELGQAAPEVESDLSKGI